MKHILSFTIILLIILSGCTEEDLINPIDIQSQYSIEIIGEELEIKAFEGTEATLSFVALVTDYYGDESASGVEISFTLIGEGCSVSPAETTSDGNGIVEGVITVTVPAGESTVQLLANVSGDTDVESITVIGLEIPTKVQLTTSTPSVTVIDEENVEIWIIASATNDQGVGLPDIGLRFALYPSDPAGEIFGSISQPSLTGRTGRSTAYFNSLGGTGGVIVRCTVDGIESDNTLFADLALNIVTLRDEISEVSISVNPDYMKLADDSTGTADVYARVMDENNNGIVNLRVNFSCEYGSIGNVTLTDEAGLAQAEYRILPMTDFPLDTQELTDNITAEIPNTLFSDACTITTEAEFVLPGRILLTSDVDFIYADNGLTTASLQIVLKDGNNQALANREIILTASHGSVISSVITDELGMANATFTDTGLPSTGEDGGIVPAVITAEYAPWSLSTTVEITILERNPVASIALQAQEDELTAGSGDSLWIGVVCFLANGSFATNNTEVFFECDRGRVEPNPALIRNGSAGAHFIPDYSDVGTTHIRAYVDNGDSLIYSNIMEIRLVAGPPTRMSVRANPPELRTTEPTVFSTITATVRDTANNHVSAGYLITFEATLGSLDRVSVSTDDDGEASVKFRAGVESGVSVITATLNTPLGEIVGTTTVDIKAGEGNSIELSANPMVIAIEGTGVNSSSTLTASLYDPNHNLVEHAHWIIFEILNELPYDEGGCHFRNRSQIDSAQTSNGRASVRVNAGTISGPKLFKASAYFNNRQDTVSEIT